jgi:hypothetical protein
MGKQIRFFVTQNDVNELIKAIKLNNGIIVDSYGEELHNEELESIADYEYCEKRFWGSSFFIKLPSSKLAFSNYEKLDKKYINQLVSEIIQFNACAPHPKKVIDRSPVDNKFKKGGFIVIHDSEKYHRELEEYMKNPLYIDNPNYVINGYEHGRFWYEPKYYDEEGKHRGKLKDLDGLFNNLSKFIKMNFKLTADKYYYIAPDAYKKYQEGVFVPSSGRNVIKVD